MIRLANIQSITDFQRSPKQMIDKLKESQEPIVLTINGRAEVVVQDAGSYQKLLDQVQSSEDLEAIRDGLAQSLRGEGRPSSDFFRDFESEHGL